MTDIPLAFLLGLLIRKLPQVAVSLQQLAQGSNSDIKIVVSIKPIYLTLIYYMRYKAVYTVHTKKCMNCIHYMAKNM